MSDELKPCPFCGGKPFTPGIYNLYACGNSACAGSDIRAKLQDWNIRTNPDPWRPIETVPRDGRLIETLLNGRLNGPHEAGELSCWDTRSHWRNHIPPLEPKEAWERCWERFPEFESCSGEKRKVGDEWVSKKTFRIISDNIRQAAKEDA